MVSRRVCVIVGSSSGDFPTDSPLAAPIAVAPINPFKTTMRRLALLIITFVLIVKGENSCKRSVSESRGRTFCQGQTIFEESFQELDLRKWKQSLQISGENYEFVTYKPDKENMYVQDGKLYIVPTIQSDDYVQAGQVNFTEGCTGQTTLECAKLAKYHQILPPVNSGRICTSSSFSFKYGKVTVSAKFPSGDWLIPQFFLKPVNESYGPWYMSGKMLIASVHGGALTTEKGEDIGPSLLRSGLLLAKNKDVKKLKARFAIVETDELFSLQFHEYTFIWGPDKISFYIDGMENRTAVIYESGEQKQKLYMLMGLTGADNRLWDAGTHAAPFDLESHICLELAVGGHYGIPDGSMINGEPGYKKPWKNLDPKAMYTFWEAKNHWAPSWSEDSKLVIDSVKVTAL